MAIATDAADLLSIWGQTLTIVRRTVTYGDTGKPTATWTSQGTATGLIQPAGESVVRTVKGVEKSASHSIFFANATNVLEEDRVRPAGWAAGDDEYEVVTLEEQAPSHTRVTAQMVKGHGG